MESLYEKGLKYLENEELDEAEKAFLAYLESNPQDALAHNKLGVIYARRHDFYRAKERFGQALIYNPRLAQALNNLGNLAREEGEIDIAIGYYQRAIEIDPDFSAPHNNLAVVYKQLNHYGPFVREIKLAKRLQKKEEVKTGRQNLRQWISNLFSKPGN